MKRILLAVCTIAAATIGVAGLASAQDREDHEGMSPGHMGAGPAMRDQADDENCHLEITHRIGRHGSVTVRRRVCD